MRNRFELWHVYLPLISGLVLFFGCAASSVDLEIASKFYNQAEKIWPYRELWWSRDLLHTGGRYLIIGISIMFLVLFSFANYFSLLKHYKYNFLYLVLSLGACTGYVGLLKKLTLRHCPDQFDIFGGVIPFSRLLEPHLYQNPMGRCFPAAHASAGFALVSLYFAFSRNRILSFCGLGLGLCAGIVFSFVQMIRGAHFISHNIASALLCWIISLLLWRIVFEAKCNK